MEELKYTAGSKCLKWYLCFLISLGVICGGVWSYCFRGYYHSFPVTYNRSDIPFIETTWQGNTVTLGIDVGCRFPLFLKNETLEKLDKQFQGTQICRDLDGTEHETASYLIPHLELGGLDLKNVMAYKTAQEDYDSLGGFLGGEFNILLDFLHDRIIACDSFSKLQSKKITDQNWIQVPFELHRAGVIFQVDTDFGIRKLGLKTGCTTSLLSSFIFPKEIHFPFVSSSFILNRHRFENVLFNSFDMPKELCDIDGFIGMDFLKNHPIYLDYAHKIAYIAPPVRYFERIPIDFDERNTPLVDISLGNAAYSLKLDLGSCFYFSLSNKSLEGVEKVKYGTARWHDFRGAIYESPAYTIPEIKIGSLKFSNVIVNQSSEQFHINTTLVGNTLLYSGVIGRAILEKYNLLLDFPHSTIYASTDLSLLQEKSLFSNHYLSIPFTPHADGIILPVETDNGTYRLIIDTGTTSTAIRTPHSVFTKKFSIMNHDFGKNFIIPLDINSEMDFDGCIGMDFLLEHPIFIDYTHKVVYIDLAASQR